MSKFFIVVDSNILISRLLLPNSLPAAAVRLALNKGIILISEEILLELTDVFTRKKFDKYVSLSERKEFIRQLEVIACRVEIVEKIQVCRDPKDDKFLELAINGKAKFIMSGDEDLLVLNTFQGIEILSPRNFIEKFG